MLKTAGLRPWNEFVRKYGDAADESLDWNEYEPECLPGRLRMSDLLYAGTLDGQQIAFIPADVSPLLRELLKKSTLSSLSITLKPGPLMTEGINIRSKT
jgi:hypothetical protein